LRALGAARQLCDDPVMSSPYTGRVSVGGPAQTRTLGQLSITKVAVGRMDNNAYLLRATSGSGSVLVDAAAEPETLLALVDGHLDAVVTTHRHGDHIGALAEVVARTGATAMAGTDDAEAITAGTGVRIEVALGDLDRVEVGDIDLEVVTLVGHTPGSIALVHRDEDGTTHVLTGDSLFPGGVGNTHGSVGDFRTLLDDVEHKLFDRLPDDTLVYPGHGADTTLAAERPSLPVWRERGW